MKSPFILSIACAALLAAQCASASSHNPHEVYVEAGLLSSKGIGYAHSFNDIFGVRADFSNSIGGRGLDVGKYHYDAALKGRQMGAYADWFPFGGKFHLTAGLHSRKLEADVDASFKDGMAIEVGGIPVANIDKNDWVKAKLEWPTVAPYLGLGFGHSTAQRSGFGFVTEIGVTIGAPKVQLSISKSLREKVDHVVNGTIPGFPDGPTVPPDRNPWSGFNPDDEIENQRRELADDVSKIKVFPHMYIGLAYRF